jgi:uncharacterized protein YbbK (DUF523 family)
VADRPKLLVSACLLGSSVRYDGSARTLHDDLLDRWRREGRVVSICPELLAGLPTPRLPAEIVGARTGRAVLNRQARVIEADGADVTSQFVEGALSALELALERGCRFALMTDGSPSCGSTFLYDGSFTGRRLAGEGVAAALFRSHGIAVFSPNRIHELAAVMEA